MAAENSSRVDRRLEALQEREAVVAQLLARPLRSFELLLGNRFAAEVEGNQEVVRIAVDARASELLEQLDTLPRLRASLRDVAERDDQIRLMGLQIGERGTEGDRVAVHVREEGDSHSEQLMGTP